METIAKIKNAHIVYDPEKVNPFLFKHEGKEVVMKLEGLADRKSYEQLKFYFGIILPAFVQATGETGKEKLDAYLRDKYLSSIHFVNGNAFKYIPTLQIGKNKVNRATMTNYIETCLNELIDCGGSIPMNDVEAYREIMLSET